MFSVFRGVAQSLRLVQHASARQYSTAVAAAAGLGALRRLAIVTPSLGLGAYVVTSEEPRKMA